MDQGPATFRQHRSACYVEATRGPARDSPLQPLPRCTESGARQASLINEETGLGRSVTARPRPAAGKGAPWTPPGYPPGHSPGHPPGYPRPMHVFRRTFPLVQLAPPEEEEMWTEEKGSGRAAEAGAEEQAATRGRRAGRLATLGLRCHHL